MLERIVVLTLTCALVSLKAILVFAHHRPSPSDAQKSEYSLDVVSDLLPSKDIREYKAPQRMEVVNRDERGRATQAFIRVLVDNSSVRKVEFISELNGFGKSRKEKLFKEISLDGDYTPYFTGIVNVKHGMKYRLLIDQKEYFDPAGTCFSKKIDNDNGSENIFTTTSKRDRELNSVFWDFERPDGIKQEWTPPVDLMEKGHLRIVETDLLGLVKEFSVENKKLDQTYRFVATSGIINKIKDLGYNAIEFLPLRASPDDLNWIFRYQEFGHYAPDPKFGTPDDFRYMLEAFNHAGVGVILDMVIGHFPVHPYDGSMAVMKHLVDQTPPSRSFKNVGLHLWKKKDGRLLYGREKTPWNTLRFDYANKYIQDFLIGGILQFADQISGIRIDNLDGIVWSESGLGEEFIRRMVTTVREYRPHFLFFGEIFSPGNEKLKGVAMKDHQGRSIGFPNGLGMDLRNASNRFDVVKDNFLKGYSYEIDFNRLVWSIKDPIINWDEAPSIAYLTTHDEAGNPRDGATGKYLAAFSPFFQTQYGRMKIGAWESLYLVSSFFHLSLIQTRTLQTGSFSTQPEILWWMLDLDHFADQTINQGKHLNDFLSKLFSYVGDNDAFSFKNRHDEIINHVDEAHKIISIKRIDFKSDKEIIILINLGHYKFDKGYTLEVDKPGNWRVVLAQDDQDFGGSGKLQQESLSTSTSKTPHGKEHSINIPHLEPYDVVVLEN